MNILIGDFGKIFHCIFKGVLNISVDNVWTCLVLRQRESSWDTGNTITFQKGSTMKQEINGRYYLILFVVMFLLLLFSGSTSASCSAPYPSTGCHIKLASWAVFFVEAHWNSYGTPSPWSIVGSVVDDECGNNPVADGADSQTFNNQVAESVSMCFGSNTVVRGLEVNSSNCHEVSYMKGYNIAVSAEASANTKKRAAAKTRKITITDHAKGDMSAWSLWFGVVCSPPIETITSAFCTEVERTMDYVITEGTQVTTILTCDCP